MFMWMALTGIFTILSWPWATVACLFLFLFTFQNTQGPVGWLYVAEVTVDASSGVVMSGQFLNLSWLSFTMEYLIAGPLQAQGTFFLFAGFNLLGAIVLGIYMKETRGLSDSAKKLLYTKQHTVRPYED